MIAICVCTEKQNTYYQNDCVTPFAQKSAYNSENAKNRNGECMTDKVVDKTFLLRHQKYIPLLPNFGQLSSQLFAFDDSCLFELIIVYKRKNCTGFVMKKRFYVIKSGNYQFLP